MTKSSQLVATELFELLHAIGAEAKSIVFSDSRQDAASMALEIERLHLRDLRREILVAASRAILKTGKPKLNNLETTMSISNCMTFKKAKSELPSFVNIDG